jgi:hypothetical protein
VASGRVTSFAGNGKPGYADGKKDQAQFWEPAGLAMSNDSKLLYVCDANNFRIRVVDVKTQNVSTLNIAALSAGAMATATGSGSITPLIASRRRAVLQSVTASPKQDCVAFKISLPAGTHFTEGATSRWQVNEVSDGQAVSKLGNGDIDLDKTAMTGMFTVDRYALLAPSGCIEVEAAIYYCSDDSEVCRTEAVIFNLDLTSNIASPAVVEYAIGTGRKGVLNTDKLNSSSMV